MGGVCDETTGCSRRVEENFWNFNVNRLTGKINVDGSFIRLATVVDKDDKTKVLLGGILNERYFGTGDCAVIDNAKF
jgi:hypothetical protein